MGGASPNPSTMPRHDPYATYRKRFMIFCCGLTFILVAPFTDFSKELDMMPTLRP